MKVLLAMTTCLLLLCFRSYAQDFSGENECYICYKDCQEKGAEICYYRCPSRTHFGRLLGLCYELCIMTHMERCMRKGECQLLRNRMKMVQKPEQKPAEKPEQKPAEIPEQKPAEIPEQKPEQKPQSNQEQKYIQADDLFQKFLNKNMK